MPTDLKHSLGSTYKLLLDLIYRLKPVLSGHQSINSMITRHLVVSIIAYCTG